VVSRVSFLSPHVMPNPASPVVSMMCGTTVVAGTWGLQLMSHFNRARKKFKSINKMFPSVSGERKVRRGIFLKSGGERPVGWVKCPIYGDRRLRTSHPVLPWIGVIALGYCSRPWFARSACVTARQRNLLLAGAGAAFRLSTKSEARLPCANVRASSL